MGELLARPQPAFRGNAEDLQQFLSYAASPIRTQAREDARLIWEAYKLNRQFTSARVAGNALKKGGRMRALRDRVIDLRGANLDGIVLGYADLRGALFDYCSLQGAWLKGALLENASFIGANLSDSESGRGAARLLRSDLHDADFTGANLRGVDLSETNLRGAILERADCTDANLMGASIVGARVDRAVFRNVFVYGVSAWDLIGEPAVEQDLVITPGDPAVTVDQLRVAQFIYLLLDNPQIRNVIETVTAKSVLILGRFTAERKPVLDGLRKALRGRGLVPMLFDFEPSKNRDLTETVQILAGMSRFVIADLTDAKSVGHELSHIVPTLASVAVQPILLSGASEYAMFEHWKRYAWVLPEIRYDSEKQLTEQLLPKIIGQVESFEHGATEIDRLRARLKELGG